MYIQGMKKLQMRTIEENVSYKRYDRRNGFKTRTVNLRMGYRQREREERRIPRREGVYMFDRRGR